MKKLLCLFFTFVIVLTMLPFGAISVDAASRDDSGYCGDYVTYHYSGSTNTLTLSGFGEMYDYASTTAPWYNYDIKKVVVGEGITSIGNYAFSWQNGVSSLSLPSTLTRIGIGAFEWNSSLTSLNIPSVVSIETDAFYGCKSLVNITLPNNLKYIGETAFHYCQALREIVIPASVVSLEYGAFFDCASLKKVYFIGNPPTFGSSVFYDVTASVYVSKNKGWESYTGNYGGSLSWYYASAPTIASQPQSITVASGSMAKTTFYVNGVALSYQWYYCDAGSTTFKKASITNPTYAITMTNARSGRKIYCVATDAYGNSVTSNTVILRMVGALEIVKQPTNVAVASGAAAKTTVNALGTGLKYQWYVCNPGSSSFVKSSATSATYSTTMKAAVNGRKVYCVITDSKGQSVKTNTVTLSMAVQITKQPTNVIVANNTTAKVSVTASGSGLKYQWYVCNPGSSTFGKSSVTSSTYSVKMTAANNGRKVYCVVTDKYGKTAKTNTVTLNIKATITKQPTSVSAANGATAKVSVTAAGTGLKYQWYICNPGSSTYSKSSVTSATYSVAMKSSISGRKVYCVVTDSKGNSVKSNVATLTTALKITQQPTNTTVANGSTAKVTVKASGNGLKYQWYVCNLGSSTFNKSSVTSATYSVAMKPAVHGRKVYCVITDKHGKTVKTNTVTLSIKGATVTITKQPVSVAVYSNQIASVSVTANGTNLKYQWYVCNPGGTTFSKSSITSSVYSVTMTADRSGRKVYCLITDAYGNTAKTNTVTINCCDYVKITKQPSNTMVAYGADATVSITATGYGTLTYTWYYRTPGSSYFSRATYQTTNTYTLYDMDSSYSGTQVYCIVSNEYGASVTSNTVTLSMQSNTSSSTPTSLIVGRWDIYSITDTTTDKTTIVNYNPTYIQFYSDGDVTFYLNNTYYYGTWTYYGISTDGYYFYYFHQGSGDYLVIYKPGAAYLGLFIGDNLLMFEPY